MNPQANFKGLPVAARHTVVLFGLAGLASLLYALAFQRDFAPGRVVLLLALASAAARIKVNLFKGSTLSFLTSVVLLAVIKEGPAVAVLVGLCGVTVQTVLPSRKLVPHQLAFNAGMIALTVTASWWTYHLLPVGQSVDSIPAELAATILASFIYFLGNSISVSLIVALTKGLPTFQIWRRHFLFSAPSFLIAGLLALGVFAAIGSQNLFMLAGLLSVISIVYYCSVNVTEETAR
jgi:hypothetical protein